MVKRKKMNSRLGRLTSYRRKRQSNLRLRLNRGFIKSGVRNLEILDLADSAPMLGRRGPLRSELVEHETTSALQPAHFTSKLELKMNRLVVYPRGNHSPEYLVTLRDLVSLEGRLPESLLVTTFGYEKEFIDFLLQDSKVEVWHVSNVRCWWSLTVAWETPSPYSCKTKPTRT